MNYYRNKLFAMKKNQSVWNILSAAVILFQLILLFYPFPFVMDDWYHAAVIRAFYENNGVVLWDSWEFAPFGRPHLYPPLIHAAGALIAKTVFYKLDTASAILNSVLLLKGISFSFLLFSIWLLGRMFSRKTAFLAVLLASQSAALLVSATIMLPSAFALGLLNFLLYSFEKKSAVASIILLTLIAYTHLGIFSASLLTLLLFSIYQKRYKEGLSTISASLILSSPWLMHVLKNAGWLNKVSVSMGVSTPLILIGFALAGISAMAFRHKEKAVLLAAYIAGLSPMLLGYGNRFWGYALIPLIMFGAYAIAEVKWKKQYKAAIIALIVFSFIYTPTIHSKDSMLSYMLPITPGEVLVPSSYNLELAKLSSLDSPLSREETHLIDWISKNTADSDIISAEGVAANIIYVGTGRRATGGSWQETVPQTLREKIRDYEETKKGIMVEESCPGDTEELSSAGRLKICRRD